MKLLKFSLQISRPKFWLYLGGTYLVGFSAGSSDLSQYYTPLFWINLLYFLIPANIFLYGINDLYDTDTDSLNPKKKNREHLLQKDEKNSLKILLLLCMAFFFLVYFMQSNDNLKLYLMLFMVLSYLYSAPPVRFKSRPFLDFLSNILYAIPGFLGYYQSSGNLVSLPVIVSALAWTSAMHLFSAIPDINADKKAGVTTTAVFLGKRQSLLICFILWLIFCLIVWLNNFLTPLSYITVIYPLIPLYILTKKQVDINKIYWFFPYINGLIGFMFFWMVILFI